MIRIAILLAAALLPVLGHAAALQAGVASVEITDHGAGPVNDPSFVKALVLKDGDNIAVLITVDAVAIGEIGRIGNDYLAKVRHQLQADLGIPPENVIVNASHCHSVPRRDSDALTVQAVKEAHSNLVPVKAGVGEAHEDRISENRRIKLKDGSETDMRRAYSMPRDEDIAEVGPIDPQVGILRLDRADGGILAIVYNFACHPIMHPPHKGNSADFPGFASKAIEDALGGGAVALFVQGCAGDINPVRYKEVQRTPDAEPLGYSLGLNVVRAVRKIEPNDIGPLTLRRDVLSIPRGKDFEERIAKIESTRTQLLGALKPTNINFKTFLPLLLQHRLWPDFPSHYAQGYLHEKSLGHDTIGKLDADNRASLEAYLQNIAVMEQITRLNTNLGLLRKHLAQTQAAGEPTLKAEICGIRIGRFKLVTFPGELTVQIGLNIKKNSRDPHAFVAGYTNGYIYYTPTVAQRLNPGFAQEDCDTLVAPDWQQLFETKALDILKEL